MNPSEILSDVEQYYSEKIKKHGPVPAGVDWNSEQSQLLRFDQLLQIIPSTVGTFSLLDFGCGYGSLYHYMSSRYGSFSYAGYDISNTMIAEASRLAKGASVKFSTDLSSLGEADFTIASGVFNVRQTTSDENWLTYIKETLVQINRISRKGLAFNLLTGYSDESHKKDYLFYADPGHMFDFCKRQLSKNVVLLHDYPLYEFTLLIRKNS